MRLIKIDDLNFTYKNSEVSALKNINLNIDTGKVVLICGKSGCGKSSVCKIINGLIPNYFNGEITGELFINGDKSTNLDMVQRSKFIGSVFQNPKTQFFNSDVTSEIAFTSENLGVDANIIKQQVEKQIKDFNLENLQYRLLYKLSGGEKQRVACAGATAMEQSLIILDEPSSNLDYKSIEKLKNILELWKKQGKTIIICEHRLYYLKDLVDEAYLMDKGEIIKSFTSKEFSNLSDDVLNAYALRSLNPLNAKSVIQKDTKENSIIIENLTVKYKEKVALDIKNFSTKWNGVCAIVGDNGAGKSTFINSLAGLVKTKKLQIVLNSRNYTAKELQKKCYIVSQDVTHQLFAESVYEELACTNDITQEKIDFLLKELQLYDKKDVHPMALSGGERQRLAVAVALAIDKEFIFFDEPTSGLDFCNMQKISKLLNELSMQGKTIFVITHDIEFIINACNYVLLIKDAKIQNNFTSEDFIDFFKNKSPD